jgi:hypothetical protein
MVFLTPSAWAARLAARTVVLDRGAGTGAAPVVIVVACARPAFYLFIARDARF